MGPGLVPLVPFEHSRHRDILGGGRGGVPVIGMNRADS